MYTCLLHGYSNQSLENCYNIDKRTLPAFREKVDKIWVNVGFLSVSEFLG
jgi:hypothetical protein